MAWLIVAACFVAGGMLTIWTAAYRHARERRRFEAWLAERDEMEFGDHWEDGAP